MSAPQGFILCTNAPLWGALLLMGVSLVIGYCMGKE